MSLRDFVAFWLCKEVKLADLLSTINIDDDNDCDCDMLFWTCSEVTRS
jgi:hypothetical protein